MEDQTLPLETVNWREKIAGMVAGIDRRTVEISAALDHLATRSEVGIMIDQRVAEEIHAHGEICELRRKVAATEDNRRPGSSSRKTSEAPPPVAGILKNLDWPLAVRIVILAGILLGSFVAGLVTATGGN